MDILDILLDILLKPPQPFIGLFLVILLSPCGPHHPRIVPVIPTSSPCHPHHPHVIPTLFPPRPQKVPMWSPWSVVSTCCPCRPHIVPVIHMSSPSSPHCLDPPDTHSTHPPPPWGGGGWGPRISKNAIRFELIKIF